MKSKYSRDNSELRTFSLALDLALALGHDDVAASAATCDARSLTGFSMDYSIADPGEFRDRYWAVEAFSKTPFTIPGVNREETAYAKFWQAEEACRQANHRLVEFESRPNLPIGRLRAARDRVHSVLGSFSLDECLPHFNFGPGASTSLPRRLSQRPNKWLGGHITGNCLPLFSAFRQFSGGLLSQLNVEVVSGNKVTTVPKNAKTDRVIAIEPDWNSFFQKGVGGAIRHRLQKRLGLLKPDAQIQHQMLARQASLDGRLATIDLKAASDSVSLALVELLLPDDWFKAILMTRSPVGIIGEKTITYEKVSSMGNGFTFELETLIFWALTHACCSRSDSVSVYGDDIVCPTQSADAVIDLIREVGLEVNEDKTFTSGPFRESCGGHYHTGFEVTPPYFRHLCGARAPERIRDANKLSRVASQRFGYGLDGRFRHIWDELSAGLSRFYGPQQLGDSVLCVPFDVARPRTLRDSGDRRKPYYHNYFRVEGFRKIREDQRADHIGGLRASLWYRAHEESQYKSGIGLYRREDFLVERWYGPDPWLDPELCV